MGFLLYHLPLFALYILKTTPKTLSSQTVQSLIDLSLLEFTDHFHVLLTYWVLFEVVEFCCIVREIEQVYTSLMLLVKLFNVLFDILIEP